MYHYLFTNDLRISTLADSLKQSGKWFVTDTVPSASVNKSANNNAKTLGFYFNFTKESNCAKAAMNGDIREVVLNFIKKFQFPNPRTESSMIEAKKDGIILAPMRVIVKLLYVMQLMYGNLGAFLTQEEIKYFIFYNDDVAKKKNPDIDKLIRDLLLFRKNHTFPANVSRNEAEHHWNQEDRQIREMLKILTWSGCIAEKDGKYIVHNNNLSALQKAEVFDIVTYNEYWDGTSIGSYVKYMDVSDYAKDEGKDANINIPDTQKNPVDINKRSFIYWLGIRITSEDPAMIYQQEILNDQYVNYIEHTFLPNDNSNNLFYTTDPDTIKRALAMIPHDEKKHREAVEQYLEFVNQNELKENSDTIYNHNLFGIHIKEKNDALSETIPHICIGWSMLGDLSGIKNKEELNERYSEIWKGTARSRGQNVGQIWRFYADAKIGDYVVFAERNVFHIGRIESDYYYDTDTRETQSSDYRFSRKVIWLKKNLNKQDVSKDFIYSLNTGMSIWSLNDYRSAVSDLLNDSYIKDDGDYESIELNYNTSLKTDFAMNRIIFGAPGTGKSHKIKKDCDSLFSESEQTYERVTFHPDYTYSKFVGTYKPITDEGEIKYKFIPGPFLRVLAAALENARTDNPQPYLLIIEEINRSKIAAVFGDVFQLLDRDEYGVSEYDIHTSEDVRNYLADELNGDPDDFKTIRLPNNMFIWATMNSADQGVYPMDTAFKRRWNFEYLGINANENEVRGKITICGKEIEWNSLRRAINDRLSKECKVNEDKLMGPFFISSHSYKTVSEVDDTITEQAKFIELFKSKVLMYLYEDAAKQFKQKLFAGCNDCMSYSEICDKFDSIGIEIFGNDFVSVYEAQLEK